MRLSTRGRFAITAMIDLSLRSSSSPVPLVDLALRHHISLSYLEQVFAKLRQHGLVQSTRGPGGGYALAIAADTITVADIIGAIEDTDEALDVGEHHDTSQSAKDMTQELWGALHSTIVAHMRTITLRSLAVEQQAKGFAVAERKPSKKGVFQKPKLQMARPSVPNSVFALGQAWPVSG